MINCAYCNKEFNPRPRLPSETPTRYCSRPCYYAGRRKHNETHGKKLTLRCDKCKKVFYRFPSQSSQSSKNKQSTNFCSRSCANSANHERAQLSKKNPSKPKIEKQCKHCGNTFFVYPYRSRIAEFCSRDCFYEYKVKKTDGNYKNYRADIRPSYFRNFPKKCAICDFDIVVSLHHIVPKSEGGADSFENLIPLCPNHHALADRGLIGKAELNRINPAVVVRESETPHQSSQLSLL